MLCCLTKFLKEKEFGVGERNMAKNPTHGHKALKQAGQKAGEFFLHTLLVAVPLYLLFSSTVFLHEIAARLSQFFLSLLSKTATLTFNGVPHLLLPGLDVEISNLCSGGLELALLAGLLSRFSFWFASLFGGILYLIKNFVNITN